ncbi:MAG: hypothetical protein MUO31_00915 [Thermodesulfovibrionales bacterium]|nr:hypothetical protein [Thermodesulfovibrionales bacterium]
MSETIEDLKLRLENYGRMYKTALCEIRRLKAENEELKILFMSEKEKKEYNQ